MRNNNNVLGEVVAFTALVSVECTNVGMNTLYKAAVAKGLNFHVYMAYAYAISAITLLPLAFLFHRKTPLPPLSIILVAKFFILGFLGFSGQYLGNLGIKYSSPTMASAMSNIAPASTFFLAIIFRMEKVMVTSISSQGKVMGALVSIAGALIVVLYNGPLLISDTSHIPPISTLSNAPPRSDWILGGALNAACYAIASIWYIFQGKFVREYPAKLVLVFFQSFFSLVIAVPVGIASEPHLSSWKVPPAADIRFLSILYSGIMGSGYGIIIHTWGLHVKGPLYVALFRPLSIAIAAILGVIFLGDDLYLGTVIGSVVITMGFYTVVWGKHREEEEEEETSDELCIEDSIGTSRTDVVPLLKHRKNSEA